jgi:prepilin-type N-terminal cleavage/methylation domain-containing protein
MKEERKGLSLIELLVVMSILAILSAMSIPNFRNYLMKSRVRVAKVAMSSIRAALEMYKARKDTYPVTNEITSLTSLYKVLSPYLPPRDPNNPFPVEFLKNSPVSYTGTTFNYTLEIMSRANTPVTATAKILSGVYMGEEIQIPY